ncbi:MAG: hypothetical protein JXA09_08580 [Anaerolineae bacterium]|nr:hypothetical protein [Anaerolineae bacterium]
MTKVIRVVITPVVLLLALLSLAACAAVEGGEPTAPPPTAVPPEATAAPPVQAPAADDAALTAQAISDLAARAQVSADDIVVREVRATEFSDASLGAPEPGKMYAQVITPGYVIRLAVGNEIYVYHASGDRVVLAAQERSEVIAVPGDQPVPPAPGEATYHTVEVADTGLSIQVPAGWARLEPEWLWTPTEGSALQLGVRWADLQPPQEAEPALLPGNAQTLYSEEVALGWAMGRRTLLEVYETPVPEGGAKAAVQSVEVHVLAVVVGEGGRRAFDLFVRAPSMEDMGALDPVLNHVLSTSTLGGVPGQTPGEGAIVLAGTDPDTGWQVLRDDGYGFEIAIPPDWAWREMPAQGPGVPGDWPTQRFVLLFPQAWEADIVRSGPPDPNAKLVVAPVQVEVIAGAEAELRRVYAAPGQSEPGLVNGAPATIERETWDQAVLTRYVVPHTSQPEVLIVISDQLSGYPDRMADGGAFADSIPAIVETLTFP